LNEEITRQTVWSFNQDKAHAVSCNALKQSLEAFTLPVVNGTAHAFVPELPDHLNPVTLGVDLNGFALPRKAITRNLPNRGHTEVRDGLDLLRCHSQSVSYSGEFTTITLVS
jgi:hypothetical protein